MLPIITTVGGWIATWFTNKQALNVAQQNTLLSIEQAKADLAMQDGKYESEWELASLSQQDKWIRRFSFLLFTAPFLVALYSPEAVKHYFEVAVASVPLWWQQVYVGITGGVWGISSLKNVVPSFINLLKK